MGTQGLVSVVGEKSGKVIIKAIAGCNGYNATQLKERIESSNLRTVDEVYEAARACSFGCEDCLVVMSGSKQRHNDSPEKLGGLYESTFDQCGFNPRWERGTADYVYVSTLTKTAAAE